MWMEYKSVVQFCLSFRSLELPQILCHCWDWSRQRRAAEDADAAWINTAKVVLTSFQLSQLGSAWRRWIFPDAAESFLTPLNLPWRRWIFPDANGSPWRHRSCLWRHWSRSCCRWNRLWRSQSRFWRRWIFSDAAGLFLTPMDLLWRRCSLAFCWMPVDGFQESVQGMGNW